MIVDHKGKTRSVRTKEERDTLIQKEMDALTPEERDALKVLMGELGPAGPPPGERLIDVIGNAEYRHTPVDMRTFVMDRQYLGNTCDSLYPKHLADLTEMFENGGYHQCIYTGGVGVGKTFTASIGICRVLYEISCLKDPHRTFGLAKDTNISIIALSVNQTLATKVVFENIATKLKASPYFEKNFPFEITKTEMRFPGNIWIAARATTDTSALGLNVIAALMDEASFMHQTGKQGQNSYVDHAETIYNGLIRRMKSRFERGGRLPGMFFIVSSKRSEEDFVARLIRSSVNDPTVFVSDYNLWEIKSDDYYSTETFAVLVGNAQIPSKILEPGEEDAVTASLAEGAVVVKVPIDFRPDFERDLENSIRDIAGISTVVVSPFIQRREKITEAYRADLAQFGPNRHPFSAEVCDPSRGGTFLWDRMVGMRTERTGPASSMQMLRPLLNPDAPRHIHIDPSLRKDALGFAMAHIAGQKDVVRRSEEGAEYTERAPVYVVDLVLRITPPVGGEIILGDVRRMVYELAAHGYLITSVSMDGYQSADGLQQLRQKGYNSQLVSVDISMDPYENLKTSLYENRIYLYEYRPLSLELQQLEMNLQKRKVDHPYPRGSKDISDALAGALHTLSKLQLSAPLTFFKGQSVANDRWMPEQAQAVASASGTAQTVKEYGMLPPMLGGNGGGGGWPNGGNGGGGWENF